tara:strand:- start:253 stop:558 length:306 start_codon:yes stop_codon:yes gene_type:complete
MKRKAYLRNRSFTSQGRVGASELLVKKLIKKSKKEIRNMAVQVTKEDFLQYKRVQESGEFNMFDPSARMMTDLSREQWVTIMRDYKSFNNAWGKKSDKSEK